MKSTTRSRRLRNAHQHDEKHQEPFFTQSQEREHSPFFSARQSGSDGRAVQPKLTIGKPGDRYEQEADRVASNVVAKSGQSPGLQRQEPDSVQRVSLMSPAEDERLGTAEARMEKDKLIQEKIQTKEKEEEEPVQAREKEEEEPVQAKEMEEEEPVQAKEKEEEEPVQAKEMEEEEPVQAKEKEEEEPVQAKEMEEEEPVQAKEKEEEEPVQAKEEGHNVVNQGEGQKIKNAAGAGQPLSGEILAEMEHAFGADFSGVNIHTDAEAVRLNEQLHSQAFTRGQDIFFNEGMYRPETSAGKRLLAHELAHVVQQCGRKVVGKRNKSK